MANNNEQVKDPGMTAKASKKSAKKATLSAKDKLVLGGVVVGGMAAAIAVLFQRVKRLEQSPAIQVSERAQALRYAEAVTELRRKQSAEAATMWSADVEKVKEASEKESSRTIYAKA